MTGDHNVHSIIGGKVVDKREIVYNYGLNAEEVDALCKDMAEKLIKELPVKMSEEVKGIVGDIVDNEVSAILLHMEKQAKSEDDLRDSIAHNFNDMRKDIRAKADELLKEFNTLREEKRTDVENLQRLCRQTARQADEAFGNIIGVLSKIKDIAQEFKENIRLDHTYELTQGWENIREGRFDTAKEFFDRALQQVKNEAEAYFGMYLADCKIQVLWDCVNCRWQPICHDIVALDKRLDNNSYYNAAVHYADDDRRRAYEAFYDEIKYIKHEFEKLEKDGVNYDCFICVKITDEDGKYTKDSHDAMLLYGMLKDAEHKPFYSDMSVRYMKSKADEAHILYALYKSKCMIVVCSNKAYLDTPWMKNEYTRYFDMINAGYKHEDSIRIVCQRGCIITQLPGIRRANLDSWESITLSDVDTGYRIKNFVDQFTKPKKGKVAPSYDGASTPKASDDDAKTRDVEARLKELEKALAAERQAREKAEIIKNMPMKSKRYIKEVKTDDADTREKMAKTEPEASEKVCKPSDEKSKAEALPTEHLILFYDSTEFEVDDFVLKKYKGKKEKVSIPNGVASIGDEAFLGCADLTSITIPNSVQNIGDSAFCGCTNLTSITVPNSVKSIGWGAFCGCTNLTSITIPNSVTSIGQGAFYGCTRLTSITIPNSVISIGDLAFYGCTGLTSITIPNSVTSIGLRAFYGCTHLTSITVPNSMNSIGDLAFEGCTGLTSITIPNSVKSIGLRAFYGCTHLTSITVPNSMNSIGDLAFEGCTGLTSITIPNSVTSIGLWAFKGCTGLTSITIPNSVTSIGRGAFEGCTGLTSITIPNSMIEGQYTFSHENSVTSVFSGCTGLTSITIPNSVTRIGFGAFSGCTDLTSITIPNSVTSIDNFAFSGCTGLTSITIPNSVTRIGFGAFSGCTGLTSIKIPNSVTRIGECAFSACTGLKSVKMSIGFVGFMNKSLKGIFCDQYKKIKFTFTL